MSKIIVGLIGKLASGKGAVAKYLKEKHGYKTYAFSAMLRDILRRLYIATTRENLQTISQILRENFGQDLMSRVIAEDVLRDAETLTVVDGVRRPTDIMYLKTNPHFYLIYITADPKIRWQRLVQRNQNPGDDKKTFAQFCADDAAEAETLIEALGKKASYTINNNGTMEQLNTQMETILIAIKNAH